MEKLILIKHLSYIKCLSYAIPIVVVAISIYLAFIYKDFTKIESDPTKTFAAFIHHLWNKLLSTKRKDYYELLYSQDFMKWEDIILKRIYGSEVPLIKVFNIEYPVACYRASEFIKYPFSSLYNVDRLPMEIHKLESMSRIQKQYKRIINNTIRQPKLVGFALDRLYLDDNMNIISFTSKLCTYENNLYTSHILEYELYKCFKKEGKNKNPNNLTSAEILKMLPLRHTIHKGLRPTEVIITGKNRFSLLGVQAFVVFFDKMDHQYKVLMMKRSEDVANRPGFYQFIPSGGFEIFENVENDRVIKNNYSLIYALFREFVEEIFGDQTYLHNKDGIPVENILKDKRIRPIVDGLIRNDRKTFIEYLGTVTCLVELRMEHSFLIRIDDESFSMNQFKPDHEGIDIQLVPLKEIEEWIEDKTKLNPGSAGLLYLALQHKLIKEIM